MFSTGHSMSQSQQNLVMCTAQYVIALGFCVVSRKRRICTRITILEKRLKIVHSTYWKCFYHQSRCHAKSKNCQTLKEVHYITPMGQSFKFLIIGWHM